MASRTRNDERCDSARKAEVTPRASTSTTGRRDLDSAKQRSRTKKTTRSHAGSAGSARADASTDIDGSWLTNVYVTLENMKKNEGLTKAYLEHKEWNMDLLRILLPDLPYAKNQVNFFWAKHCRGVCMLHYPPSSESGPNTNLSLNVHKTKTKEDEEGRIIYKLKSSCMMHSAYATAHWLLKGEDKYTCQKILVTDDDGKSRTVDVDKRSAVALDFDHLEMFPTFDDNKMKIKKALQDKYGKAEADAYMEEAGKRYARRSRARGRRRCSPRPARDRRCSSGTWARPTRRSR